MTSHRGAHPQDSTLFSTSQLPRLRAAVTDLSWLRSRGYGDAGALKLVGDRYQLKRRQRNAVARSACSDQERSDRLKALVPPSELQGKPMEIDAFNVLITIEGALGGAYLFIGRDTAIRDVDPLQGTYRLVHETEPAITALRETLLALGVSAVTWRLDSQVSNVGRVKTHLEEMAPSLSLTWSVVVEDDVDSVLKDAASPVATSDSEIVDHSSAWTTLEAMVVSRHFSTANVRDLRPDGERSPLSSWKEFR